MKRKTHIRFHGKKPSKLKECATLAYEELCANFLLNTSLKNQKELQRFSKLLCIQPKEALVLIIIISGNGKITIQRLTEFCKPYLDHTEINEVILRLKSFQFIKGNVRFGEITTIQMSIEVGRAIDNGDIKQILGLRPKGSEGILNYIARIGKQAAPIEYLEFEYYLDNLFDAQDSHHAFLAYLDDLDYLSGTIEQAYLLLIAMKHYFWDEGSSLSDFREFAKFPDEDLKALSIDVNREEWKPIRDGFVAPSDAGFTFSSSRLKLTELGINTFFPDLNFECVEDLGSSIFKPHNGIIVDLCFPEKLHNRIDSIQKIFGSGIYEKYVNETKNKHKGLLLLIHGEPGVGKTAFCYNLLAMSKRPYTTIQSTIVSKWMGETASQLQKLFNRYHAYVKSYKTYPVILLNECDSLLITRTQISSSSEIEFNSISTRLLENIEEILNIGGLVIATTNSLGNIDPAFFRRFTDIVEFTGLDLGHQKALWINLVPELKDYQADFIIENLGNLNPGMIQNIAARIQMDLFLGKGNTAMEMALELGKQYSRLNSMPYDNLNLYN